MSEKKFLSFLREIILETIQEVSMDTVLSEIDEWDSLAIVSFESMANTEGKKVDREDIKNAHTVRDLYVFLQS